MADIVASLVRASPSHPDIIYCKHRPERDALLLINYLVAFPDYVGMLYIDGCSLSDRAAKGLALLIERSNTIRFLHMANNNNIGDVG